MIDYHTITRRRQCPVRSWALILPLTIAAAGLLAFVGITRTAAQSADPVFFTNCATNTGVNASMGIPAGAPQMHTSGYFTPTIGDEFAVVRPVNGTCATTAPSLCAGSIVWEGTSGGFPVWGDDFLTPEVDGMLAGEMMCWRVWDASEDMVYTATVEYVSTFPYNGTGLFAPNGLYQLESLTPTALKLAAFKATSSAHWVLKEALWAGGILLTGAALVFFRRRNRR